MAKREPNSSGRAQPKLRCAIYTRKSSEEGLEQEFNSLDAQREACEAFIASQKHEGWGTLKEMYDDGGFSGGSMERPALGRLLADIATGKVDVVVVYKVDRLTRSLSDFARIVDIFDKRKVSFVSVTQAFNTTSSMGRLTLNVLLSFAQFEREVTGERIRDKIAASKRKGMWMGGQPALGYDVRDRKLVVNETEAQRVRHIFRRYRQLGSVRLLKAELDADGVISKQRTAANGSPYGGQPFSRGALYLMLSNRLYRGQIVHKGSAFSGEHAAIVDEGLWTEVQDLLAAHRIQRDGGDAASQPSLLVGLVFDAQGERLTPTHSVKKRIRYRYYVSQRLIVAAAGEQHATGKRQRILAATLEGLVKVHIRDFLADPSAMLGAAQDLVPEPREQKRIIDGAAALAGTLTEMAADKLGRFLRSVVDRIQVHAERIEASINIPGLIQWLSGGTEHNHEASKAISGHAAVIVIPARLKRAGLEMRFVIDGAAEAQAADASLTRIMARAHMIRDRLVEDRDLTVEEVAREEDLVPSYVTRLLRLTFLAPDIVTGILSGRHPPELTARKLMADTRLPLDWNEQRTALGFAPVISG